MRPPNAKPSLGVISMVICRVSPELHGIKHFLNSVSDVGLVERHSDEWGRSLDLSIFSSK
jgi:hypothetical protein